MLPSEMEAVVEYTTRYISTTPFAILVDIDYKKTPTRKAYFALYDDGWRIKKKKASVPIE